MNIYKTFTYTKDLAKQIIFIPRIPLARNFYQSNCTDGDVETVKELSNLQMSGKQEAMELRFNFKD